MIRRLVLLFFMVALAAPVHARDIFVLAGPAIRVKALAASLLAVRGGGLVYDSRFGVPMPVALWDQQIKDEDFEFPMAVDRAVLRCYSIPASPVETVAFRWIPTSIGAVAF